ncbi:glyoxalase/bleomycin resistance/extradiol dioxygenase family protein [Chitinophaga silvatica]|uniref:Glyoxalase/bleomycin resistance/extradiol dioxygenase family protein n=1 Tax=Chitinophaga silvatica TaxID=2282649 RepID=A0A3E1Y5E3_9BACT|nr:VOC family protein [Chitinophaga silvatica]RFS19958.1 glyoxalase/bleomycin resistance/extradiol dioxygenase family protein [Chitinophaga silvatica]
MANLNLIVIKTDKLQEQAAFYTILGWQFDYHKHGNGPYHYASVGTVPVLEIYPLPKGVTQPDKTTRLGFAVENLPVIIDQLKCMGANIISAPGHTEWGFTAIVEDLDGRKIELTEV